MLFILMPVCPLMAAIAIFMGSGQSGLPGQFPGAKSRRKKPGEKAS